MSIALRIIALRQKNGWSLSELARRAKISKGHLSKIENSQMKNPGILIIMKLANALHTTPEYLLQDLLVKPPTLNDKTMEYLAQFVGDDT